MLSIFGVKLQNVPFAVRKLEMKSQEPLIKPGADFVRDVNSYNGSNVNQGGGDSIHLLLYQYPQSVVQAPVVSGPSG